MGCWPGTRGVWFKGGAKWGGGRVEVVLGLGEGFVGEVVDLVRRVRYKAANSAFLYFNWAYLQLSSVAACFCSQLAHLRVWEGGQE